MFRLPGFVHPPVFADEEQTHRARLLNALLWCLVLVPIPNLVRVLAVAPDQVREVLAQTLIGEVANVVLLVLLHRGFVRLASLGQVTLFLLFFTGVAGLGGRGVHGPAYQMGFLVVILVAGLLLGVKGTVVFTVLALALGAGLVALESAGALPTRGPDPPLELLTISAVLFSLAAVLQYLDRLIERRALALAWSSEARYRQLVDESPAGILVLDGDLHVTLANPAACAMLGSPASQLAGRALESLLPAEPAPGGSAPSAWVVASGSWEERALHRSDGVPLPVLLTAKELPQGGIQLLFQDISERKGAEAAQRRLAHQLAQSQRLDSIGRLAGGVAHDFNNLLTTISGNTEMALAGLPAGSAAQEDLEQVLKAARSAASLTRQLLGFSRRQTAEPRVLELSQALGEVKQLLGRLIGEDVRLEARLDPEAGSLRIDPGQLEQIVVNLVVNARDAMPRGGLITLATSQVTIGPSPGEDDPAPGRYVELIVSDTGSGIPAEALPFIFEPFYTTKEPGKGTGLGLATVLGIVKQNGGAVTVRSEVGRGSTFRVLLPWVEALPAASPGPAPAPLPRGHESIVLVEDDAAVRVFARRVLERAGYQVTTHATGSEALAEASRGVGHSLLLSDVVMPGMNGRDLAVAVQAVHPGTRVLFTSGYTADVIAHHGLLHEAIHFLAKPYSSAQLAAKVREVLDAPGEPLRLRSP